MEQLVNFIIRPPRAEYNPKNDLLDQEFMLKGKWFQRKDLELVNSRGDVLQCSHYMPIVRPEGKDLPCVIYCHGNSGCRADASEAAIILLPSNITVFTLDFSGSGISGGEHVTLGWNEKDDLRAVVNYLRADGNVSLIGLWGRSMGAVTSLMYGAEDPSIAGMVLDSPFSDLVDLMMELVDTYKIRLPKFTVKFAIHHMRRAIQKKAKFDIVELNTIKVAKSSFVSVLFGHAIDDDFIQPHHSDRIFDAYVGDKNIIKFEGDHNSPRPQFYFDSINIFFHNVLQPPDDEVGGTFFDAPLDYFGKVPSDISSKDKQSEAKVEGSRAEPSPSSSRLIDFEFSNGHPVGPLPTSVDDDEYVEYPLDNVAGVPCNVEEERMFMEAEIESLKDLETRHPNAEGQQSNGVANPPEPSQKDDPVGLLAWWYWGWNNQALLHFIYWDALPEFVFLDRVTELLSRVNAATRLMPFDRQHVFAFLVGVVAVYSVSLLVLVLCGSCFLYVLGYYRNNQKITNQFRRLESEVQEDSQASLASMNEEEVEIEEDIILRNKEKVGKGSFNVGSLNLKSYNWFSKKAKKNIQDLNYPPSFAPVQVCRRFTFDDIKLATENFNDGLVIGKGGFGKVYKGFIDNGATTVAIKRLDPFSKQGGKEFRTEIDMLSTFRHSHLVSLIGYCNKSNEMILLYEHMSNGSMADHLHIKKAKNGNNHTLSWVLRLKICIGAARGLEYLHTGTGFRHRVIHRDVKSSNILLDENWTAKISDFGLSKVGPANQSCTHVSTFVKGTPGYWDPEYFATRRLTRKSDVYSFGVVLFEVLCGRPVLDSTLPEEQKSLAEWAQQCIQEDKVHKIIDPNLRWEILPDSLEAFVKIADQCLHSRQKKRPTMAEVVASLESALALQERRDSSLLDEYIFSFGETCDNQ